jgi:hypothetical protein
MDPTVIYIKMGHHPEEGVSKFLFTHFDTSTVITLKLEVVHRKFVVAMWTLREK